jgi:hypothetical protein
LLFALRYLFTKIKPQHMSMKTNWKGLVLVGLISSASTLAGFKLLGTDSDRDVIIKEAAAESINRFTSTGIPVSTQQKQRLRQ